MKNRPEQSSVNRYDVDFKERWPWVCAALLVVALVIAYQQVWHAGFIWDDDAHLTKNPCIVGPVGFKGIWTTTAATYYPLVLTNFWIQHKLWSLNPLPYHLVNVAMHAACAISLWRVLLKLRVKGAWLGAAVWALHPVQVESVAWITELKNTQSCFFYLLSILFFLRWRETKDRTQDRHHAVWSYALSILCAVLAILSKSSTVMLPIVLGLCWWWMEGKWRVRYSAKLIPFLIVSAIASAWTIWEQKFHNRAIGAAWNQTLLERVIIAGRDIWFYLGKLLWPHPLVFIYPQWEVNTSQVLQYVPLLAAIAGLIFLWWKRQDALRPVFFAAAYFIISLFPVLGFFDVYFFRYSFVGDHFQYLASIGPLVLVGSAINSWFDAFVKQPRFLKPVGCAGLLCLLGVLSWQQSKTYRDQETLWRMTLQKNPNSWMVRNSVAVILLEQGRVGDAMEQLKLVSKPDNPVTQGSLGAALLKMGQLDAAYLHLRRAIELEPTFVAAYVNMGSLLLQNGQAEESHRFLEQALRINPDFVGARSNMANTLLSLGRPNEALYHLQKALESAPYDAEAQKNMAWIMATSPDSRIRNGAKAVELAERANQLTDGRNPLMLIILAAAYAEAGRFSEALSTAERAVQAANDSGDVALAHAARAHIAHYRSGQPVRDVR